ncbi:MAG: iron-sulfur cluster repair di-iron protein [Flavobacteriaceae bacterium]|nr:iron-sulfur cluster repair di-iron protein [Flavobacteriaceae bacterium]
MNITKDKTVAETVTENIKSAHIFKKYGIDFCCGGGVTIEKACAKKNIDYLILKKELDAIDIIVSNTYNYDNWNLSFLIDHILNIHHTYVEANIPLLIQYANRVAKVHGHHYTEVVEINNLFTEVANELMIHMKKEENILFPYIKQLVAAKKKGILSLEPPFGTVKNPIQMMEDEHENAGNIFKKIAKLSTNYTPPKGACNTFKALYAKLEEFEQDLHQHIHLENNILFPKAIELEKQ